MDPYHPVNGAAGNCKPPISANKHDTPGNGNHSKPRDAISGILERIVMEYFDFHLRQEVKNK